MQRISKALLVAQLAGQRLEDIAELLMLTCSQGICLLCSIKCMHSIGCSLTLCSPYLDEEGGQAFAAQLLVHAQEVDLRHPQQVAVHPHPAHCIVSTFCAERR